MKRLVLTWARQSVTYRSFARMSWGTVGVINRGGELPLPLRDAHRYRARGCPLSSPSISYHPAARSILLTHGIPRPSYRKKTRVLRSAGNSILSATKLCQFYHPPSSGCWPRERKRGTKESEIELGGFRINRLIKSIRTGIMEESGMEKGGRKEGVVWNGKEIIKWGGDWKKVGGVKVELYSGIIFVDDDSLASGIQKFRWSLIWSDPRRGGRGRLALLTWTSLWNEFPEFLFHDRWYLGGGEFDLNVPPMHR